MVKDVDWMASDLSWPGMTFVVPCRLGSRDTPRELLSWTCFSLYDSSLLHNQQRFSLGSVNAIYYFVCFVTHAQYGLLFM